MRIGILGGLFPKEIRKEIESNSKGPIQYAADTLQWNIVNGLDEYVENLSLINLIYVGSYPSRYDDFRIKSFAFSHKNNAKDYNIGFINLPLYKLYSRYLQSKNYLKEWVSKSKEVLIIYSVHTPFILAAIKAKQENPKLKICLVVPDLPEFMGEKGNFLIDFLKNVEKNILRKALLKIDAFVVLSEYMTEPLNIGERPWICVEGVYSGSEVLIPVIKERGKKSIFYSGTLAGRYGILNLLNAFASIPYDNYELWICGDGDTRNEIISRSKDDPRIKFFGQLPREEVLALQKSATVVVNPRTPEGEFTKYSFPSKTIEYLASGTPTILYKLPGIPKEYFEYCFTVNEEHADGLKEIIVSVCEKTEEELNEIGRLAFEFIINNKTASSQGYRIFKMLEKL